MLKRRFIPYIVGFGIVVSLFVFYAGCRAYQNHVEFKHFISDAQAFNRSVAGQYDHASHDHTHSGETSDPRNEAGRAESEHAHEHHRTEDGKYVYEIGGRIYSMDQPLNQQAQETLEWVHTGKRTPLVEALLNDMERSRKQSKLLVVQQVIAPDGKRHQVIVPRHSQYEEGDALLKSELDPDPALVEGVGQQSEQKLTIKGVEYPMPDEYYAIQDPYERLEYTNKFSASIELGISMEDVEKKVAVGELNVSLSDEEKRHLDQREIANERRKMLKPVVPEPSDRLPVKIRFLPEDGNIEPGWSRKNRKTRLQSWERDIEREESVFNESGINEFSDFSTVGSDVPVSPSDLPDIVKPTPSPPSVTDIEKQFSPEGIEAKLTEGLSTSPADKAQQLIDQYGTEEGLRRLRESDPDAARRFEQGRRPSEPSRDAPQDDGYSDDPSPDDSP